MVGHGDLDDGGAHGRLELGRGALGDLLAAVDDGDQVRQPVGLLEVLGREQDGGAVGHELLDHHPEVAAAGRVEARRRLVEEQHRRPVHEGGTEVEPSSHAAGVGPRRTVGGMGQPELLEELVGPGHVRRLGEVGQLADEAEVLPPGEVLVDRRVLAGQPDALADGLRVARDIDAEHAGPPGRRAEDGRQDPHGGGLAGAVGAEQTEDGAPLDLEVDPVEGDHVAEVLDQALDADDRVGTGGHRVRHPTSMPEEAREPRLMVWCGSPPTRPSR